MNKTNLIKLQNKTYKCNKGRLSFNPNSPIICIVNYCHRIYNSFVEPQQKFQG